MVAEASYSVIKPFIIDKVLVDLTALTRNAVANRLKEVQSVLNSSPP